MILLAAVGRREEAGHRVRARRVSAPGTATQVEIVEEVPGDFCSPAARTRYPFHIVVAPRGPLPVIFRGSGADSGPLRMMMHPWRDHPGGGPPVNLRRRFALVLVVFSLLLTLGRRSPGLPPDQPGPGGGARREAGLGGRSGGGGRAGRGDPPESPTRRRDLPPLAVQPQPAPPPPAIRGGGLHLPSRGGEGGEALVTSRPHRRSPSEPSSASWPPIPPNWSGPGKKGEATTRLFRGEGGQSYKYGFKRLGESDAMMAVLMQADFLEPLARLQRSLLLGALLGALAAGLLAYLLAAGVVQPLERLSRAALRIQRGRWETPVAEERGMRWDAFPGPWNGCARGSWSGMSSFDSCWPRSPTRSAIPWGAWNSSPPQPWRATPQRSADGS
jgi:hypothetical protein